MELRLSCKDYQAYPYESDDRDLTSFKISKYAEKDIVNRIAEKFAQT